MIIPATPHNNNFFRPALSMYLMATKVNMEFMTPINTVCISAESTPTPADFKISGA